MIGISFASPGPLVDAPWRAVGAAQVEPPAHRHHLEQPAEPIHRDLPNNISHETIEHIVEIIGHSKYQYRAHTVTPQSFTNPTKECHHVPSFSPEPRIRTGPSGQIYAQIKKAIGSVPNTFAAIAAHGPAALKAMLAADAVLAAGTLTKRDQEVIKLVISGAAGCDYCVAAHNHLASSPV